MPPRLVVGLTGGIGSGKSAAANCFAALGVPVIDADVLARELVTPGQPALRRIVETFGEEVLDARGALDRGKLRGWIFADPTKRRRLEGILHPVIRTEMKRRLQAIDGPYCVLCIPLLLESGQTDMVDRVLVVDAPPELQIQRVQARDGTPRGTIEAIMATQLERGERRAAADDVIENGTSLDDLRAQVEALHQHYLRLADAHLPPRGKS